jgi:hypothetical protein
VEARSAWTGIRIAAGVFNLVLGAALLTASHAIGYWAGALPLAASVLIFWTSYRLRQSVQS